MTVKIEYYDIVRIYNKVKSISKLNNGNLKLHHENGYSFITKYEYTSIVIINECFRL